MFLMKLSFSKNNIPQTPIFSTYAELLNYNAYEVECASGFEIDLSVPTPSLDEAHSICDDNEIPEQYSPSLGPRYLNSELMRKMRDRINIGIGIDQEEYIYAGSSTQKAIDITTTIKQEKIKSEIDRVDEYIKESEDTFIKNLSAILRGLPDADIAKQNAFAKAYGMYFYFAFRGLYHAKAKIQEIILNTHVQISPNKELIAFEYAIICCLSKIDFVFDKDIVDLSSAQNAYRQALANDSLSGEDDCLLNEMLKDLDQYESIIMSIKTIFAELILTFQYDKKYNALQDELAQQINRFKNMNAHEKFNITIYIVAEVAMQELCEAIVKDERIRGIFIDDVINLVEKQLKSNADVKQDAAYIAMVLKGLICKQDFLYAQSNLRQETLTIFSEVIKFELTNYVAEIMSCTSESLIKIASKVVLQKINTLELEKILEDINVLFIQERHESQKHVVKNKLIF